MISTKTIKLAFLFAVALVAIACFSTPAMADDDYSRGGHEPVLVCFDAAGNPTGCPPEDPPVYDCTPQNPCNCGGEDNPCPTAVVGGQVAARVPVMLLLRLVGRL